MRCCGKTLCSRWVLVNIGWLKILVCHPCVSVKLCAGSVRLRLILLCVWRAILAPAPWFGRACKRVMIWKWQNVRKVSRLRAKSRCWRVPRPSCSHKERDNSGYSTHSGNGRCALCASPVVVYIQGTLSTIPLFYPDVRWCIANCNGRCLCLTRFYSILMGRWLILWTQIFRVLTGYIPLPDQPSVSMIFWKHRLMR